MDGRTTEHGHPISSPCEPSAQVKKRILRGFSSIGYFLIALRLDKNAVGTCSAIVPF